MNDINEQIARSLRLKKAAAEAMSSSDYAQAERLFRAAVGLLTGLLDPMHKDYVEMLKGLLISLEKQKKTSEASRVRLLIVQMCQEQ